MNDFPIKTAVTIVIGVLALLTLLLLKPFEIVDTGHRGIEIKYGKVVSESLEEGLYLFNPVTTDIVEMDVRTQILQETGMAYTKDVQQASVQYVANFNLDKRAAHIIYQEIGRDWQAKLVPQIVSGTLKNVIGKWDAVDLVANRDKATAAIELAVTESLAEKHVTLTKFEIINIDYNDEFERAVEAKVTAIQRASEAENKTRQVQEEAKQKVIAAQAEAESMRIRADALTQNKALVEYEAVQKWDGKLPVYMLGEATPFIRVGAQP